MSCVFLLAFDLAANLAFTVHDRLHVLFICLSQPYDVEYADGNLRPIYCSEDSRIMWSSVSGDTCMELVCNDELLKLMQRETV